VGKVVQTMYTHVNVKLLKGKKKKVCLFGFKKMIYYQIFIQLNLLSHSMRPGEREEGREGEGRKR
jgi:hypothetical protein